MMDFKDRNNENGKLKEWNETKNLYNFETFALILIYEFIIKITNWELSCKKIGISYFGPTGIVNM